MTDFSDLFDALSHTKRLPKQFKLNPVGYFSCQSDDVDHQFCHSVSPQKKMFLK